MTWLVFDFLFQHFANINEASELERIARTALARHRDEKTMLDRLFNYYRGQGDYEKAKDALLRSFQFAGSGSYYANYNKIKAFLTSRDWDDVRLAIFEFDALSHLNLLAQTLGF